MAHPRTVNLDLPPRTSRDHRSGAIRYKRPDNGAQVYLTGIPDEAALRVADTLNAAFGLRAPRGMRHIYRTQFQAFRWTTVAPEIVRVIASRLSDILLMQRDVGAQEEIRHSWAYAPPPETALRRGLRPLKGSADWIKPLFMAAQKNARARELPFELSMEDVQALIVASDGRCTVTGIALSIDRGTLPAGRKMRRPWAPSLDRIDSSIGYVTSNCRIVCCAANYAMSQWGEDVLIEMAKAIARKRIRRMIG